MPAAPAASRRVPPAIFSFPQTRLRAVPAVEARLPTIPRPLLATQWAFHMSPRLKIPLRLQRSLCPHPRHPSIPVELVHGIIPSHTHRGGKKNPQLHQCKVSFEDFVLKLTKAAFFLTMMGLVR